MTNLYKVVALLYATFFTVMVFAQHGVSHGKKRPQGMIVLWHDVQLTPGNNGVRVAAGEQQAITDRCTWYLSESI